MAKQKPSDERTFTTVVLMERDSFANYVVHTEGHGRHIIDLCWRLMQKQFPGLCKWLTLPRHDRRAKQRRVEVRLRILDDPKTPKG